MLMPPAESRRLSACCISHEFFEAASRLPDKIAVVHASGFTGIVHDSTDADRPRVGSGIGSVGRFTSSSSSVFRSYDGDECFTFSDILSAVEYLSSRLSRILDGGDDPHVITTRPANSFNEKSTIASGSLQTSSQFKQQSTQSTSVRTPKVIGIYMEPCVEYIVTILSVLRCGEAFMPLDPTWPKARILAILSSSKADLVVGIDLATERNYFHRFDTLKWLIEEGCSPILPFSLKDCNKRQPLPTLEWPCKREQLRSFCYLIYSSGSSGKPKGVCGTEIGLLNRFLWMQEMYPPDEADIVLFKTAISFIDHLQEFLGALLSTCTLVIPPFNRLKENIFYVVDYLQGYSINRFVAVPSLIMKVILPYLQSQPRAIISTSLKLLVLSGEVLHIPLCKMLLKLLPKTVILNLYGSTEVTGDCTYFDCRRLPLILEKETLSSVPIGLPMSNCDVVLVGENTSYQGEIYVGGLCVAAGYFCYPYLLPLADEFYEQDISCPDQSYFKTGDFAKRLPSGDLVFLGRKDRIIKVNGQRIALEEIEGAIRDHPGVLGAAVLSRESDGEVLFLEAHVMTGAAEDYESFRTSLRNWLMTKLPQMMIPSQILFTQSLPFTSSGKVDYLSLAASTASDQHVKINIKEIPQDHLIRVIKQVFCDALMVERVSEDDDFFMMGGNSISAAYASFKLGIHMKFLFNFPTPRSLQMGLLSSSSMGGADSQIGVDLKRLREMALTMDAWVPYSHGISPQEKLSVDDARRDIPNPTKKLKTKSETYECLKNKETSRDNSWNPTPQHPNCSFQRCNNNIHGGQCEVIGSCDTVQSNFILTDGKGIILELWKVDMGSCVDASPLVVCKGSDVYVFIGSHSHKFVCMDGKSGIVQWEAKLEGRVECSAAILDDLSQVVVGCYQGSIYFLHFSEGSICWSFQTNGEVKSQPVVDRHRHLVWCGSYDHNLYALDYKCYSCIYSLSCEGSIFGSPVIDEIQETLYVASTSGHVTALEIKTLSFKVLWKKEMEAPIFSSLAINSDGNVICCSVDGSVTLLDKCGSTLWKAKTGGPIFAGPCMSLALPSQLLICSRDGSIYSFEMVTGDLIWKHAIGHPITSSPYVDEDSQLLSSNAHFSSRLICVSDSSGTIHVLKFSPYGNTRDCIVEEFARLDLQGDIFSSPVMIGGRIFVGCRDDCVYCLELNVVSVTSLESQVDK